MEPRIDSRLRRRSGTLCGLLRRRAPDVVANLVRVDARDELVLGREDEERGAVQRVGSGREDGNVLVQLLDPEEDLRAFGTADPVPLARLDRLRPIHGLEVVEEHLRVVGDPEEPLLHDARLDHRAAALARAVREHLLVRDHGLVVRTPLDRRALPVREPALVELQELPLLPAVVLDVVGRERAVPVVGPADPPHRARDVLDVPLGALARMDAVADRSVLGRQPERVESLRVQHVHAVSRAEARDDVPDRVDEHVPHVEGSRRIREASRGRSSWVCTGSFETWNAFASSQTRCHFCSIALASYLSITVSLVSEEQKSLSRERLHENGRGSRRARPLTYARSLITSRKRYQAESGDARTLSRLRARRTG